MALTQTTSTCKCGASITTAFTSELTDWHNRHMECIAPVIKKQPSPYEIGAELFKRGFGLSHIWGAVASDDQLDEALKGYTDASKQNVLSAV